GGRSVHRARFQRAWPAIPDRLRTYSTSFRARRAIPKRAGNGGPGFRRLPPAPSRTRPGGCRAASTARASWSRTASTERVAARSRSDKSSIHRSWSPLAAALKAADVNGSGGKGNRGWLRNEGSKSPRRRLRGDKRRSGGEGPNPPAVVRRPPRHKGAQGMLVRAGTRHGPTRTVG